MTSSVPNFSQITVRPLQYRDLEAIESIAANFSELEINGHGVAFNQEVQKLRSWYGLIKFFRLFPHSYRYEDRIYIAQDREQIVGLIQVSPFNSTRTTWRINKLLINSNFLPQEELLNQKQGTGSQLLRYCLEKIWQARTWILEVNIQEKTTLGIYRQNGFNPLAQMTYWSIAAEGLRALAIETKELPNFLPVSNAEAQLIYQLDCVSMPPLLRQVFDRHIDDFKINFVTGAIGKIQQWLSLTETTKGYIFEPQRKAAIGYFKLDVCKDGSREHQAKLIVHPAYTWLYPKLLMQMAKILEAYPSQALKLASADYQPEREQFLEKLGATRVEHTLLMSRSVWHKLRESKPLEALQLSEVLQGLQPARTPIPSRISWQGLVSNIDTQEAIVSPVAKTTKEEQGQNESSAAGNLERE